MTWLEHDDSWRSPPYQIHRGVMGFSAYIYAEKSACLAQQIASLERAKEICKNHKGKIDESTRNK